MPFELPPDSPVQNLQAQAEGVGSVVAAYFASLTRNGVPEELAGELTMNYADHLLGVIYRNAPTQPPPTVDE